MRRRWLGLILGIVVLATAPGCRVLAGAAVIVGEAFLEGAIDGALDDDDCDAPKPKHRASGPRRARAAPGDPRR